MFVLGLRGTVILMNCIGQWALLQFYIICVKHYNCFSEGITSDTR